MELVFGRVTMSGKVFMVSTPIKKNDDILTGLMVKVEDQICSFFAWHDISNIKEGDRVTCSGPCQFSNGMPYFVGNVKLEN